MTAEIAIMNKSAVALAADSKVTIGSVLGGKTFDTVDKVFMLSKIHPAGLMVFGNAEFMRYPWETIVKIYRSQNGARSYKSIHLWGNDFVSYLSRFGEIDANEREQNVVSVISSAPADLRRKVWAIRRQIPNPTESNLRIREHTESLINNLDQTAFFNSAYMKRFKATYGSIIDGIIKEDLGFVNDNTLNSLAMDYIYKLISLSSFSSFSSGIVIAGFGDDDIFPSLVYYETDGYLGIKNKIKLVTEATVTRDNASCIVPFAQHEMVERFMDGIDPEYAAFLRARVLKSMTENCIGVLDKYGAEEHKTSSKVRESIRIAVEKSLSSHDDECERFQRRRYSSPIVSMVSLLPKDELPNLAESLVALTSLKRHVSHDEETVGGPIDVALISKNDSFIWIKRKHYFRAELNPHFGAKLKRDIEHGGENANVKSNRSRPLGGKEAPKGG